MPLQIPQSEAVQPRFPGCRGRVVFFIYILLCCYVKVVCFATFSPPFFTIDGRKKKISDIRCRQNR